MCGAVAAGQTARLAPGDAVYLVRDAGGRLAVGYRLRRLQVPRERAPADGVRRGGGEAGGCVVVHELVPDVGERLSVCITWAQWWDPCCGVGCCLKGVVGWREGVQLPESSSSHSLAGVKGWAVGCSAGAQGV